MNSSFFFCKHMLLTICFASLHILACPTEASASPINKTQLFNVRGNDEAHVIAEDTVGQQEGHLYDDYEQGRLRRQQRLQNPRRLSLKIGFGPKYFETHMEEFPMNFDYQHVSPFSQAMLGYRFYVRKTARIERGHAVAIFVQRGQNNELTVGQMITRNEIPVSAFMSNGQHQYLEAEAGIVFSDWLRISSGKGHQTIRTHGGSENHTYYTTTLGTSLRFGIVEFDLAGTSFWGGFYKKPAVRANLSINIHLKAGRW